MRSVLPDPAGGSVSKHRELLERCGEGLSGLSDNVSRRASCSASAAGRAHGYGAAGALRPRFQPHVATSSSRDTT
jgi:hypothetical protein